MWHLFYWWKANLPHDGFFDKLQEWSIDLHDLSLFERGACVSYLSFYVQGDNCNVMQQVLSYRLPAPISILAATLQILSQKRERDEGKGYSSTKQASAKQFQKSPLLRYWIHSYIITLESFANNWSFIGWDHLKPDSTCVLMKAFYRISTYLGTNYPFLTFTPLVPYDGAASTSCPAILHARSTCILSSRNQVSGKTMK